MGSLGLSLPNLIPVGTVFTFTVGMSTSALSGIADIESSLAQELSASGINVQSWQSSGGLAQLGLPFSSFTLTGQATLSGVQSDIPTIESIINGAVQDATGSYPSESASITSITLPSSATAGTGGLVPTAGGISQVTGQPAASVTTPGVVSSVESFLSGLGSDTFTAIIVIVAVILIVLLIVGFAPNVKHIAGAI